VVFSLPERLYNARADYLGYQFWSEEFIWSDTNVTIENGIARVHVHRSGSPVVGARVHLFKGSGGYLGRYADTDDGGDAEFQLPDRQYKFRVDWEGAQYWSDPITIIPHEVNEIDMDLDLLGLGLTGRRLYAHNNPKRIHLAMVGLPYGLLIHSVIAAPGVSEKIYYYHNDHLGTPQVLTDDNGQVVWKGDYKPFGGVDLVVEEVRNNFRFPGQYFDGETGLHYNYHRYYHSDIGRYLRADPETEVYDFSSREHPYVYTMNNPIAFTDPLGLATCTFTYSSQGFVPSRGYEGILSCIFENKDPKCCGQKSYGAVTGLGDRKRWTSEENGPIPTGGWKIQNMGKKKAGWAWLEPGSDVPRYSNRNYNSFYLHRFVNESKGCISVTKEYSDLTYCLEKDADSAGPGFAGLVRVTTQ
jgi:RHS repeat-associated protein